MKRYLVVPLAVAALAVGPSLIRSDLLDRALTGHQNQRPNQVLDNPHGEKTLNNWLNPAAFAQPVLGTHGDTKRNSYVGMGRR